MQAPARPRTYPADPLLEPTKTRWVVLVAAVLLGFYYLWLAAPESPRVWATADPVGYPNLLVSGFLKGSLAIDVPADPFMETLADPRDPKARDGHGYNDTAYYEGKFYLYFGPTAMVLLLLPFRIVTGLYLSLPIAVALIAWLGTVGGLFWLERLRQDWFPRVSAAWGLAGGLVFGGAAMLPIVLRRPEIYELVIVTSYAGVMWALYASYRAIAVAQKRWLILMSVCLGLAIASRPTWIVGGVLLLMPWWIGARKRGWFGEDGLGRGVWSRLLATFAPILLIGLAVAWYNHARFGHPLEFGFKYQLTFLDERGVKFFNPSNIPFNFFVYFLNPPGFTPFFPFLTSATYPARPAGHFGHPEDPFGVFVGVPWILLGWVALRARRRSPTELNHTFGFVVLTALAITLFTCGFGGCTVRYQADMTPLWVAAGTLGAFIALQERAEVAPGRGVRWGLGVLAVVSVGFNFLIGAQHKVLLEVRAPHAARAVAKVGDLLPVAWAGLTGHDFGPLEVDVRFPSTGVRAAEVLVSMGEGLRSEFIFVTYTTAGRGRLGYFRRGAVAALGEEIDLRPGQTQRLYLHLTSLRRPALWGSDEGGAWPTVVVRLDGQKVLRSGVPGESRPVWSVRLGAPQDDASLAFRSFSGQLGEPLRVAVNPEDARSRWPESVDFELSLPEVIRERVDPLWQAAEGAVNEVLCIRYSTTDSFQIGAARGLERITWGAVRELAPNRRAIFRVQLPTDADPRLRVWVGDDKVLDTESRLRQVAPARWVIGEAPETWAGEWHRFRGRLVRVTLLPEP